MIAVPHRTKKVRSYDVWCRRKRRYRSQKEARAAARMYEGVTGKHQRSYSCDSCKGWHLTSQAS